jgi:Reverse transcriptase-like
MTLLAEHAPVMPASAGAHLDIPRAIEPLSAGVLLSRSAVTKFISEWQPMGKTAYVNSDTSFRDGRAGVAYESGAIGRRVELVDCVSITAGEYLALLMAMGDADVIGLSAPLIFRVDCEAVAKLKVGRTSELIEPRDRIRTLLGRNPQWCIRQVSRDKNRFADELASRPFLPIRRSEWAVRLPTPGSRA